MPPCYPLLPANGTPADLAAAGAAVLARGYAGASTWRWGSQRAGSLEAFAGAIGPGGDDDMGALADLQAQYDTLKAYTDGLVGVCTQSADVLDAARQARHWTPVRDVANELRRNTAPRDNG